LGDLRYLRLSEDVGEIRLFFKIEYKTTYIPKIRNYLLPQKLSDKYKPKRKLKAKIKKS
jgi:hypothetical protein